LAGVLVVSGIGQRVVRNWSHFIRVLVYILSFCSLC